MTLKYIESAQNKIIKQINNLKLKKYRDKEKLFVLEGERLVNEVPTDIIKYIVIRADYKKKLPKCSNIYSVSPPLYNKISDTVNPQGITAVCAQLNYDIKKITIPQNPFFVVLENTADPGNMGTVIRTADAAGADGIFIGSGSTDIYNPKTVRATMGSLFHLPIYTNVDIKYLLKVFKNNDITSIAAHLRGSKTPYDINMTRGIAILIGNEANGLTDEISKITDEKVTIPMPGSAESMNAGIAASILIYEAVRQRLHIV